MITTPDPLPARFVDLKREIASLYPDFEKNATKAWAEILDQLKVVKAEIIERGSDYIPQVNFADLSELGKEEVDRITRAGSVVIKDVVSDEEAIKWRKDLEEFVRANPEAEGFPADDRQFFMLYWTKSQVAARSHPDVLAASIWLNNLYHFTSDQSEAAAAIAGVDLSVPLTYADRFRIRKPGNEWPFFPPHVDGGSIERWEEPTFRQCFAAILRGDWRNHDPYELEGRIDAKSSLYGRPNQSSIFRTFQGWMAVSETSPREGTLRVFPDVLLSNSYIILRPFFRPTLSPDSEGYLEAKNWELDLVTPDFPGIYPRDGGFAGPRLSPASHPHLELERMMTSVPKVFPGDMVFWHCDVVHSVEEEHLGADPSAVMYIGAVPLTPQNLAYVETQKDAFLRGRRPPDFPKGPDEDQWLGTGKEHHISSPIGRRAMGFPIAVA